MAQNLKTGAKKSLVINSQLIEEANVPALGKILKKNVNLAKKDVAIYIVISEKMLTKRAKKRSKQGRKIQS